MRCAASLANPKTRLEFDRIAPGHSTSAARVKSLKSEGAILTVTETLRFSSEDMHRCSQLNSLHARNLMNLGDSESTIPLPPTPTQSQGRTMAMLEVLTLGSSAVVGAKAVCLANAIIAIEQVLEEVKLTPEKAEVLERGLNKLYATLNPRKPSTSSIHIVYPDRRFEESKFGGTTS